MPHPSLRHTHSRKHMQTHTAASKKSSRISFQSGALSFPPSLFYLTLSQSHAHPLTLPPLLLSLHCTFYRSLSPCFRSLSLPLLASLTLCVPVFLPRSESFSVGM